MDEQFLHYIWKYQFFNSDFLVDGKRLGVFYPGNHNMDSGPDFEESRIKIDEIEWAGQVEIHIRSSDWYHHNHEINKAYENVILHVVWEHDREVKINEEILPTLELKNKVDPDLLQRYHNHLNSNLEILCTNQLNKVPTIAVSNMLSRVSIERTKLKADRILEHLKTNHNNWEETTYQTLAINFGFSTNKEAFYTLTQRLPFSILKKNLQSQFQTEALIFGQAGFLEKTSDLYSGELKNEFDFLKKKFDLEEPMIKVQWKTGKLRPSNFPTVRLAQLATLFYNHPQLFNQMVTLNQIKELKELFKVPTNEYWQEHYEFGKKRKSKSQTMGDSAIQIILINSVAPILAAYAKFTCDQDYMDRAISLLESLSFEDNRLTRKFSHPVFTKKDAFSSQALIQLYKAYCSKRRCLHCNIGVEILGK